MMWVKQAWDRCVYFVTWGQQSKGGWDSSKGPLLWGIGPVECGGIVYKDYMLITFSYACKYASLCAT